MVRREWTSITTTNTRAKCNAEYHAAFTRRESAPIVYLLTLLVMMIWRHDGLTYYVYAEFGLQELCRLCLLPSGGYGRVAGPLYLTFLSHSSTVSTRIISSRRQMRLELVVGCWCGRG